MRSLRDFLELDSYESDANAKVILLEEVFSDKSRGFSVCIEQDDKDVILDFTSRKNAELFFLTLQRGHV